MNLNIIIYSNTIIKAMSIKSLLDGAHYNLKISKCIEKIETELSDFGPNVILLFFENDSIPYDLNKLKRLSEILVFETIILSKKNNTAMPDKLNGFKIFPLLGNEIDRLRLLAALDKILKGKIITDKNSVALRTDDDYYNAILNYAINSLGLKISELLKKNIDSAILFFKEKYKIEKKAEILDLIKNDKKALQLFINLITTNETYFFRTPAQIEILKDQLIPKLRLTNNNIVIWSAGCSYGAEPYSIAIYLSKEFPDLDFKIIASDIDVYNIDKAKSGIYKKFILCRTPEKYAGYINCSFTKIDNDEFIIKNEIKNKIEFMVQNLLEAKHKCNIIYCRNVLIYFAPEQILKIADIFYNSLTKDGALILDQCVSYFYFKNFKNIVSDNSCIYIKE